jgi:hypothetical protein
MAGIFYHISKNNLISHHTPVSEILEKPCMDVWLEGGSWEAELVSFPQVTSRQGVPACNWSMKLIEYFRTLSIRVSTFN